MCERVRPRSVLEFLLWLSERLILLDTTGAFNRAPLKPSKHYFRDVQGVSCGPRLVPHDAERSELFGRLCASLKSCISALDRAHGPSPYTNPHDPVLCAFRCSLCLTKYFMHILIRLYILIYSYLITVCVKINGLKWFKNIYIYFLRIIKDFLCIYLYKNL